jgi:hypothetical protein
MHDSQHNLTSLFDQLGLPSSEHDIEAFIHSHRPLDATIPLSKAPFWTAGQSQFLGEQIKNDADWAVVIDKFDTSLRQ